MKNIIAFASIAFLFSCGAGNAPESAQKFADKRFPKNTGTECVSGMNADSDDDGYVSCTIFLEDKAIPIECATDYGGTGCSKSGCRMATGKSGRRR